MSKILVTGGAGFIGGHLVEYLRDLGHEVTAFDNLSTSDKSSFGDVRLVIGDVNDYRDISAVMLQERFDYVYHYAAVVGVQKTLADPIAVLKDIEGIKNVLTLCKNTGVKRIFYSSSSEVYGESPSFPQNEDTTPINSRLPYAVVKSVGETMIKAFHQQYGLDYTIYRFFNTYGERQRKDFVIPRFVDLALKGQDITIYGDGTQTRTFLHVSDNVRITTLPITKNSEYYLNDTVNVGSDIEINMIDLAEIIITLTGFRSKAVLVSPLKEGDMPRRKPDIGKISITDTQWPVLLESGINRVIKSMQSI